MPSTIRIAARSNPEGKYVDAAWARWWSTNFSLPRSGQPRSFLVSLPTSPRPLQERLLVSRVRPPIGAKCRSTKFGRERVRDLVDVGRAKPRILQAEADCMLGKDMRIVGSRRLAVLDAIESLLLARRDDFAIDDHGGGRFVKYRVEFRELSNWPLTTAADLQLL